MTLHVVDLADPAGPVPSAVVIATGDLGADGAEYWLQRATFTLTEKACADRRTVDVAAPAFAGVITESLAYSTLQAGPEFARWLAGTGPCEHVRHPRSR